MRMATLAAFLMLSGPMSATVHYATVTHVMCLEHGGLVHLDAHPTGPHGASATRSGLHDAAPATGPQQAHLGSPGAPSDRPDSDEHSHCDLLATLAQSAVVETPAPLEAPAAPLIDTVTEAPATSPRAARSVYRFAPKTSPPSGDAARV
ncbi:MAG: hypothetical protein H6744_21105 [Deltaproteobacteria bacterium]|nr:hypothetical protein [Deltaproteobacteria bacterium]MCB9789183.1 hypothetical protein [Deltaproteobacteria bacterium]